MSSIFTYVNRRKVSEFIGELFFCRPRALFLLDSIGKDDQPYKDSYRPVQVPHLGLMLEHLSADEDGEPHDSPHQGVETWK